MPHKKLTTEQAREVAIQLEQKGYAGLALLSRRTSENADEIDAALQKALELVSLESGSPQ